MASSNFINKLSRFTFAALAASVAAMAVCAAMDAAGGGPVWRYGMVGAAFAAGGLVFVLWRREAVSTRQVLVGAVVFRLLFIALPPSLSDDAYRYVWDGRVQQAGVNPYAHRPSDPALAFLHEEPTGARLYAELNSADYYSVYPPVSQAIFFVGAAFYDVYDGGWRVSYYVIKGILLLLELAGVLLLSRMASARAPMLYAWNPLVLVEVAGQAHGEAALVFFLALALWAARRERGVLASVALAGAVGVKLYPVVLLPLLWRRFGWRGIWPGAVALLVVALPYASMDAFQHVRASLELYVQLFEFNAGPYYAAKELLDLLTGADWSKQLGSLFGALFLAALPAFYVLDARRRWPPAKAFFVVLGAFFLLSTTVHPWYLLAVLVLAPLRPPAWHWHWLGLCALGTYLFYVGGPYWPFVWIGWGGWMVLACAAHREALVQPLLRRRAREKARRLIPHLPEERPLRLLDLGAGEGYVGAALADRIQAHVTLADVVDLNRTGLPHTRYDDRALPFASDAFDVTVLYFVLHHAEDPEQVLREALRVTSGRVLIVESVYTGRWQRRALQAADRLANRLRGGRAMRAQEAHLRFRTAGAWRGAIEQAGGRVVGEERFGSRFHPQVLFVAEV